MKPFKKNNSVNFIIPEQFQVFDSLTLKVKLDQEMKAEEISGLLHFINTENKEQLVSQCIGSASSM